jgi:hypothetical protein
LGTSFCKTTWLDPRNGVCNQSIISWRTAVNAVMVTPPLVCALGRLRRAGGSHFQR